MNRRTCTALALASLVVIVSVRPAAAQGPYVRPQVNNPYYKPPFSPYLNLALPGNVGINYFGLVRPELAYNSQIQQLQLQESQNLSLLTAPQTNPNVPITGVPSGFMNFSHYYGGRLARTGPAALPLAVVPPAVVPLATVPPTNAIVAPGTGAVMPRAR